MALNLALRASVPCGASAFRTNELNEIKRLVSPASPSRTSAARRQQHPLQKRARTVMRAVETEKPKVDPAKPEVAKIADQIGEGIPPLSRPHRI